MFFTKLLRFGLTLATSVVIAEDVPLLPQNSPGSDCVPAGPDFPAPAHLSTSKYLASAVIDFEALLGNETLGLRSNKTAFGIAMFSAKENTTLYENYFTPPMDVGVTTVDRDSMFRIGSISKVFTVWTFLAEAGDVNFNDPVTKYVPELAQVVSMSKRKDSDVLYDDIDSVRWQDVTLGQLASQSAGITRDS